MICRSAAKSRDLAIFDATVMEKGPIAIAELAHHVPLGFHGKLARCDVTHRRRTCGPYEKNATMKKSPTVKKRSAAKKTAAAKSASPSRLIDARIKELGDWRGATLARVRALIKQADPNVIEEWKWRGVPVWYRDGMICTGETYKSVVKLTFAKGAALKDPSGLFNSSLDGNVRRAIDIHQGEKIDAKALTALIRAAIALNQS
jgi:hypothetical protein